MKRYFNLFRFFGLFICVFYTATATAQNKRIPSTEEYKLWSEANMGVVSPCGKYFTYTLHYPNGPDTLVVQSTGAKRPIPIAGGRFGKFSRAGVFACYRERELLLLELESGRLTNLGAATSFDFSPSGKYLVSKTKDSLKAIDKNGAVVLLLGNVSASALSPLEDKIAYSTSRDGVQVIMLAGLGAVKTNKEIIRSNDRQFKNLSWSGDGHSLAYAYYATDGKVKEIGLFNSKNQKAYSCNIESLLDGKLSQYHGIRENGLKISLDATLAYIQLEALGAAMPKENVQVWNTSDIQNFRQSELEAPYGHLGLACWDVTKNEITMVTTSQLTSVMQVGNNNLVLWNPNQYEPQFEYFGPVDYYISDRKGENRKPMLEKQDPYAGHFQPSPNGRFIAYYRDKQWSLYEVATGKHLPISKGSGVNFEDSLYDMPGESGASGFAGWYSNESRLIVYDEYDLWEYNLKKAIWKRLTRGREKQIHFRVATNPFEDIKINYDGREPKQIMESGELILSAEGADGNSGYYTLSNNKPESVLYYGSAKIDQLRFMRGGYVCRHQRFDSPPSFYFIDGKGNQKLLAHTNQHYENFLQGREEAINYTDSKGNSLKGILYYPPGYDPSRKYPMIVHIYQRQFYQLHGFRLPTAAPDNGFDLVSLLNDGYMVLLPDIQYELGNPGDSALRCTLAGVKYVVDKGLADPSKIGLIGHSFGGYETNYIVTHSDVFAAAVSGAAVNDLISLYLTMNWDTGRPDMWRMEHQQWRIGQSYFDAQDTYSSNSPISAAKNLNTPLLSWAGQKDHQVHWHQSIEWYLAMRRLKKRHTLLLYPEEAHHIATPSNGEDLLLKVSAWFGHYLKNEKAPLWMEHK